jgi:hypothetical protein
MISFLSIYPTPEFFLASGGFGPKRPMNTRCKSKLFAVFFVKRNKSVPQACRRKPMTNQSTV